MCLWVILLAACLAVLVLALSVVLLLALRSLLALNRLWVGVTDGDGTQESAQVLACGRVEVGIVRAWVCFRLVFRGRLDDHLKTGYQKKTIEAFGLRERTYEAKGSHLRCQQLGGDGVGR